MTGVHHFPSRVRNRCKSDLRNRPTQEKGGEEEEEEEGEEGEEGGGAESREKKRRSRMNLGWIGIKRSSPSVKFVFIVKSSLPFWQILRDNSIKEEEEEGGWGRDAAQILLGSKQCNPPTTPKERGGIPYES